MTAATGYTTGTVPDLAPARDNGKATLTVPGGAIVAEWFQDQDTPGAAPIVSLWTSGYVDVELDPVDVTAFLYRLDGFRARLTQLRDDLADARRP